MFAVISRESKASYVAVAQDLFIVSDGIIISSDILSDLVNTFCKLRNYTLKRPSFASLNWTVTHETD